MILINSIGMGRTEEVQEHRESSNKSEDDEPWVRKYITEDAGLEKNKTRIKGKKIIQESHQMPKSQRLFQQKN